MNAPSGAYAINPTLFKKLAYDPEKDFVPVVALRPHPVRAGGQPDLPVNSVKELIKYSQRQSRQAVLRGERPSAA